MGGNSASNSGGGSNRYEPPKKKNPIVEFVKGGGITGAVVRGVTKVGKSIKEDYNTKKTNEELLGSSDYQGGKTKRGSTYVSPSSNGGNDNASNVGAATSSGMVVQAPTVSGPTTAEVSQSEMSSEEARDKANLLLKKRRGTSIKSSLIATSPQGITSDKGLTLGKKTLLG